MERIAIGERKDWIDTADKAGFTIHHIDGQKYWDERYAYRFSIDEIETKIEAPTNELISMCYEAVDWLVRKPDYMSKMAIPKEYHDAIYNSWGEYDLYGRMDFSYDGENVKLLEFNADTPTALYESAVFQWEWLEECKKLGKLPPDADQFNSIHDKLIEVFFRLKSKGHEPFHFAAILEAPEDLLTVEYLADCAHQAGFDISVMDISDIGIGKDDYFYDLADYPIKNLFKLYPLEHMFREDFGKSLLTTKTRMFEPLWKSLLSNKGILPILWELFPDHPNLLPAYFDKDFSASAFKGFVRKPLLSREGANIELHAEGHVIKNGGEYGEEGFIVQQAAVLPKFGDDYALIGSWVVAGHSAGICIREDTSPITGNGSRFVPHFIG